MEKYVSKLVRIASDNMEVEGMLELPPDSYGMVLFAHGSGSSRLSERNNFVARFLREEGMGTLLIDLLTLEEDKHYQARFNIPLLAKRLKDASTWLADEALTSGLPLGLFGASTGAAAALQVAAMPGTAIVALVSRGGRPDLAGAAALAAVRTPTMLIVGGNDHGVIELNQHAYTALHCEKRLALVPEATHLFEEEGKLEEVAMLASSWFAFHFKDKTFSLRH